MKWAGQPHISIFTKYMRMGNLYSACRIGTVNPGIQKQVTNQIHIRETILESSTMTHPAYLILNAFRKQQYTPQHDCHVYANRTRRKSLFITQVIMKIS